MKESIHSISWPILILHLLHLEFITTFSLFLAELVKICIPGGGPTRVILPDMFFFYQQGYCCCADFGVKAKAIWILRIDARVLCGALKIINQILSRIFAPFLYIFMLKTIWTCTGRFGNNPFHLSKLRFQNSHRTAKYVGHVSLRSKITNISSIPVDHLPKTLSNLIIQPLVDFTRTLFSENSNAPVVFQ